MPHDQRRENWIIIQMPKLKWHIQLLSKVLKTFPKHHNCRHNLPTINFKQTCYFMFFWIQWFILRKHNYRHKMAKAIIVRFAQPKAGIISALIRKKLRWICSKIQTNNKQPVNHKVDISQSKICFYASNMMKFVLINYQTNLKDKTKQYWPKNKLVGNEPYISKN